MCDLWDLSTKTNNHRAVSASPKRRYIAELFDSSFSPKEFADNMALPEALEVWKNGEILEILLVHVNLW